ncbi:MAG TPA: hypothetical protein VF493_15830 [Terriglobales bacterium]
MSTLAHVYAWFLLITSLLAAGMRLLRTEQLAVIMRDRLNKEGARRRFRVAGIALAFGSFLTIPLYLYMWKGQNWLLIACIYGVVSAIEFVTNAATVHLSGLLTQNRIYGILYAATAVATYLVLFRG